MTTSLEQVPVYLLRRGLIASDDIVDRGLTVTDLSRRNFNYRVVSADGPSYLIKQAAGPEGEFAIRNEAAVYKWLWRDENQAVQGLLPRLLAFDADQALLILELWPGAEDLGAYQSRRGRLPLRFAEAIGNGLARLHRLEVDNGTSGSFSLRRDIAWPLTMHRPSLAECQDATPASLELFHIVQRHSEIGESLDGLRQGWRTDSFVHNDFKWDNCLLVRSSGLRTPVFKLVDWEAAGIGDRRWDTGCLLAAVLEAWVRSMPVAGQAGTQALPNLARYPLVRLHPAIKAFFQAYGGAGANGHTGSEWTVECIRFCAARLLEIAYAESQRSEQLSGHALLLIQLSLNIMRRPAAAPTLVGLDAG